jgi:hypothetical protein
MDFPQVAAKHGRAALASGGVVSWEASLRQTAKKKARTTWSPGPKSSLVA